MKIIYTENPLYIKIKLNKYEKNELWYKIKIDIMEDLLFMSHFYLEENKRFDLKEAKKYLIPDYYLDEDDVEKSPINKRTDLLLKHFIEELNSFHMGDCTNVACSCSKCLAEDKIGINTLSGINSNQINLINEAFQNVENNSIVNAISYINNLQLNLKNFENYNWEKIGGYEQYLEKWNQNKIKAHNWLLAYKEKHFKDL